MRFARLVVAGGLVSAAVVGGVIVDVGGVPSVSAVDIATVTCDPVTATEPAAERSLESYDPMTPERLIDTRDGTGGVTGALDAGCTLTIDTSSIGPSDVQALALSVTVISPVRGFFTAFSMCRGPARHVERQCQARLSDTESRHRLTRFRW